MNNQERLEDIRKGIKYLRGINVGDVEWLIERVEESEENCSHLRKSFQRQRNKAVEGWEKVIVLEKENEEYEQALEFYGNGGNYKTVIENDKEIKFLGTSLAQIDGGEVARKVLDFSRNYGGLDE